MQSCIKKSIHTWSFQSQPLQAKFVADLQVLFALHPKSLLAGMDLDGVTTKSVEPIHTGTSKVDLFLELFEAADGSVVGQIEYDSSLWRASSIQAMATALHVSTAELQMFNHSFWGHLL